MVQQIDVFEQNGDLRAQNEELLVLEDDRIIQIFGVEQSREANQLAALDQFGDSLFFEGLLVSQHRTSKRGDIRAPVLADVVLGLLGLFGLRKRDQFA